MKIKYDPKLKQLARELIKNSTLSEVLLWQRLKGGKIQGYDFHRQRPIGNYIIDFFCSELNLAIEIDGSSHSDENQIINDDKRQKDLEEMGINFLRFTDNYVKKDINGAMEAICGWIKNYTPRPH